MIRRKCLPIWAIFILAAQLGSSLAALQTSAAVQDDTQLLKALKTPTVAEIKLSNDVILGG